MKLDRLDYGVLCYSRAAQRARRKGHYSTKHVCLNMAQVGDK